MLQSAVDIEVNSCLSEFGFPALPVVDHLEGFSQAEQETRSRLFGITDLAAARASGYTKKRLGQDRSVPQMPNTSENFNLVYFGTENLDSSPDVPTTTKKVAGKTIPPGGCFGAAQKKIQGTASTMEQFTKADELAALSGQQANSDARVADYWNDWSSCLKQRGFKASSPFKIIEEYKIDATQKATSKIKEIAVADVECKQKTELVDKWQKVRVEYENRTIEKNQLALTEERKKLDKALTIAAEIVAKK